MNRKAFFRSLILGGIVIPTLPKKLILTGGWFSSQLISDNFRVSRTGNIRFIGRDQNQKYTVLELHRWLQNMADRMDAEGDDQLDITDYNPSHRHADGLIELENGFNIDDETGKHLFDGALIQNRDPVKEWKMEIYESYLNDPRWPGVSLASIQP